MGDPREIWQLKSLVKMFIGVWGWGGGIRVRGRGEKGVLEEVGEGRGYWMGWVKEEFGGEGRRGEKNYRRERGVGGVER